MQFKRYLERLLFFRGSLYVLKYNPNKEVRVIDITSGIAQASMEMASARVTTGVQMAMLKYIMDAQQETLALLLNSMGVGRNLNVQA